jgi:hypothetical protein
MTRKIILTISNFFLLVARVGCVASTLVITVLARSHYAADHVGTDMSQRLDIRMYNKEFKDHFGPTLSKVSDDVATNAKCVAALLAVHLLAVVTQAFLWSPKFPESTMKERLLHLVTSVWLPLPYLTRRGVDRGEEHTQQWFLMVLHSVENLGMLAVSRAFYLHQRYPAVIWAGDLILIGCNIFGVLMWVLYQSKVALYAGLGPDPPAALGRGEGEGEAEGEEAL